MDVSQRKLCFFVCLFGKKHIYIYISSNLSFCEVFVKRAGRSRLKFLQSQLLLVDFLDPKFRPLKSRVFPNKVGHSPLESKSMGFSKHPTPISTICVYTDAGVAVVFV